jgi:hypothetical protein
MSGLEVDCIECLFNTFQMWIVRCSDFSDHFELETKRKRKLPANLRTEGLGFLSAYL